MGLRGPGAYRYWTNPCSSDFRELVFGPVDESPNHIRIAGTTGVRTQSISTIGRRVGAPGRGGGFLARCANGAWLSSFGLSSWRAAPALKHLAQRLSLSTGPNTSSRFPKLARGVFG